MKRRTFSKKVSLLLVCLMAMCLVACSGDSAEDNGGSQSGGSEQQGGSGSGSGSGSDSETGEVASGSETGTGEDSGTGTQGGSSSDSSQTQSPTGTDQTGTPQASEANPINDTITGYYSETVAYPLLENEIIDELDYENQDMSKTRYYYNYVDLDGDKVDEIIVQLNGEYNTTDDGDTVLIVKQTNAGDDNSDDDGFDIISEFTAFANPVIISDNTTNGYRDLIFLNKDGKTYSKVVYGKDGYGKMSDAKTLQNVDDISGVAVLCNDVAKDTQNETGLLFSK